MNLPNSPELTPDPKKKKLTLKIIAGAIILIATVLEKKIVIGFLDTSVQWIKAINNDANASQPGINSVSGKNSQLDLLSTLSINLVHYDLADKSVSSGFKLSETAKNQLSKFSVKNISVNIDFPAGQDSVKLWVIDAQGNSADITLSKKEGTKNTENVNANEYSFDKSITNLPRFDSKSLSEVRIEARGLKNKKGLFAVKNLVVK
jgi:hypothetical protein